MKTALFKFKHDEIHGNEFPKMETILELRTDLHYFDLQDELRDYKTQRGQRSIDIFSIWKQEDGDWVRLGVNYNQDKKHLKEPRWTDKLFYYNMPKTPITGDPLAAFWVSCGGVNLDTKEFYLNHFAKNYHNGKKQDQDDCKVIVVRGSFGNVAGREARAIREEDIVEKYNWEGQL